MGDAEVQGFFPKAELRTGQMRRLLAALLAITGLLAGCTGAGSRQVQHRQVQHRQARRRPAATHIGRVRVGRLPLPSHDRAAAWEIPRGEDHGIEGFVDPISVLPGQPVRVYVSTSTANFRVRAFRMGWYGGAVAKLVWTSARYAGHRQSSPVLSEPATATMAAAWSPSLTMNTSGWPPGQYLLRLDGNGDRSQFVPLTVRAASAVGRVVLLSPVTTWQAYNTWGCCDLYTGANGSFATRSRAVSFDRPYSQEFGAGEFLHDELPVITEAERLGLPLDFVTDTDLQSMPHLLAGARAVISMGHDEYWSPGMRVALADAVNAGTNVAFLGANGIYRRIRLADTRLGPDRLEINYKVASEDPLYGMDDRQVTANWPAPPAADPESRLLGDQYGCLVETPQTAGVVVDPHSWLFDGTNVTTGQQLPGLIGPEIDAVQPGFPTPRPIEVLLHSPVRCPDNLPPYADASYYVARSGASVFDAGTIRWACAVRGDCYGLVPPVTGRVVQTVTDNLLRAFAAGPAGREHPAEDNLARLGITPLR